MLFRSSGNDFARSLRLGADPARAVETLLHGKVRRIDAGFAGERLFLNSFGAGFDGEVVRRANGSLLKRSGAIGGSLSYLFATVAAVSRFRPLRIVVEADGERRAFDAAWLVVAGNLPYFGGGMKICPAASPEDGLLDVCVVHGLSGWGLLRNFPHIYRGTHIGLPQVAVFRARRLRIRADRGLTAQTDGEPFPYRGEEISLAPLALRVAVPDGGEG